MFGLSATLKAIGDKTYELTRSSTVSLAVSGLSRAGKTVFLTSLMANLRAATESQAGRVRMQELDCVRTGRLQLVHFGTDPQQKRPLFDFDRYWEGMTSQPPAWPRRTGATAEVTLTLRFGPDSVTGSAGMRTADMTLRVIDYPGEWLVDLPLLGQSFPDWSAGSLSLATTGMRAELSQPFRDWLATIDPDGPGDDGAAKRGAELWQDFLLACRDRGLRFLQPGRFVRDETTPDDGKPELDRPVSWFFPMPPPAPGVAAAKDTLRARVEARFEHYRRHTVHGFFEDAFSGFSRHVVLVDVLAALNGGKEVFDDTTRALSAVHASIGRENSGLLNRLMHLRLRSGPERVLFAATKADHLPEAQQDTLATLLKRMLGADIEAARVQKLGVETMAIASIRCTEEERITRDGVTLDAVVGRPVSQEGEGPAKRKRITPQPVPGGLMRDAWWANRTADGSKPFDFPVFEPPALPPDSSGGLPHINLDRALEHLLGDRLR